MNHLNAYCVNQRKVIFATLLLLITLLGSACDSFVDVEQPNSQLTASAVFETYATANAAMADVYAQIREGGLVCGKPSGLSITMGCYADELVSYENGAYSTESFYKNSLLASNPNIADMWNTTYSQIYASNAVFAGVDQATFAPVEKQQLQGEALFVRVLLHFYLTNLFGDIPYITGTDYTQNQYATRIAAEQVYLAMIDDLERAVSLLPEQYATPGRMRPNKGTAQALLARIYLFHGDYPEASNMASAVLNQDGLYVWEPDLNKVFLKESTTTIWQLAPAYPGNNTNEGLNLIFTSGPPQYFALNPDLVSEFEPGDQRRAQWVGTVTEGPQSWYYPNKYKQQYDTAESQESSIVLRLAEQYLIRSEARVLQGDLIGAIEDLNKVRHTAGLPDTAANTASTILEAVKKERRSELFTESGHRFFDLKRWEMLDASLGQKPGWNATDRLWPLPQTELMANPYLKPQNPGY